MDRAVAVEYLKAAAKKFRELPTPPEKAESILTGDGELTPGETTNVGEFDLNADEAPAEEAPAEAAPAEEAPAEAAPSEEAPAEATPAEEAPAEAAPAEEAPAE